MSNCLTRHDCVVSFREDSPRPPVPGGGGCEEDYELAKTCSGPFAIGKVCTASSMSPTFSDAHNSLALPLKCDKSTVVTNHRAVVDHSTLQRGFEPDGSTDGVAKFSEGCPSLPSDSLLCLLDDACGMSFFRQFLSTEHMSDALDFWLTCTGFRKVEAGKRRTVAVAIYKKFVAHGSNRIGLSSATKQLIKDQLKLADIDHSVFDAALAEIEGILRHDFYPLFLKSDEYLEYVRTRSANYSPSDCGSSGFSSKRSPPTRAVERIGEQEIGRCCGSAPGPAVASAVKSPDSSSVSYQHPVLKCYLKSLDSVSGVGDCGNDDSGHGGGGGDQQQVLQQRCLFKLSSPAPVRAPAVSTLDSEIHSLSSDPITDADTFSLTDGSIDSHSCVSLRCPPCVRCAQTRSHIPPCRLTTSQGVRCTSSRSGNLAERNPQQFASLLMDALNHIQSGVGCGGSGRHSEQMHGHVNIKDVFRDGASGISARCTVPTFGLTSAESKMAALLAEAASEREESAQSILERHMSLVFDSPDNNQTPTDAAVCRSPDIATTRSSNNFCATGSAESAAAQPQLSAAVTGRANVPCRGPPNQLPTRNISILSSRDDVDVHHISKDCGMLRHPLHVAGCARHDAVPGSGISFGRSDVVDSLPVSLQQHHQPVIGSNRCPTTGALGHHRQTSCLHTEANEKVMMWMKVNELLQPSAEQSAAVSHKSASTAAAQFRQPRAGYCKPTEAAACASSTSAVLPAQPIIQDPSMPLLTPPDPATQLEEARRRLQLDATTRVPPKSVMCSSSSFGSDVHVTGTGVAASSMFAIQSSIVKHSNLRDCNSILPRSCKLGERQQAVITTSSSVPVTPVQSDATITVVYYLCDEPVPYRSRVHAQLVTLAQFKDIIAKKGAYRFYFKHACNDFNSGFVYEEIVDDDDVLPLIDGKICAKVVRMV